MKFDPAYDFLLENDALTPETHAGVLAAMREVQSDILANQEEYLQRIFGDHPKAAELARYFVLESRTDLPDMFQSEAYFNGESFSFKVHHEYRIRLKTPDELRHERVDELIEEHTKKPKICLTCQQPILGEIVESSYGAWHGAPATCVEGR